MEPDVFFQRLWEQYTAMTPQARRIHDAVAALNGAVVNDHVAFRTFRYAPLDIVHLEPVLRPSTVLKRILLQCMTKHG
ncbi:MAG: DUF1338 family protein [Gammaproteobacteria bacterium]